MRNLRHIIALFVFLALSHSGTVMSQVTSGKIIFERKTNLYKKFKNWDEVKDYIKEGDKSKIDEFELYFNDSLSFFKPKESELKENFSWATDKNTTYQNLRSKTRYSIKDIWGEDMRINDTLYTRTWKITDSKRKIAGYSCRKAIWQVDDSTRIYAWYCNELMTSVGPESFYGLPGVILGLASEDGSIIYFAKEVQVNTPAITQLVPPKTKEKVYSSTELRAKLEKEYGKEKWGKEMIKGIFGYW